ncbi:MAG: hypothetical protein DHS20C18_09170 [Saprospiraceae bacterium]|nr:MAG: hypothetical protein DHS20C18_09170 [Saprospiraceae bacterium]
MFFYLDYRFKGTTLSSPKVVEKIPEPSELHEQHLFIQCGPQRLVSWEFAGDKLLILGDPIFNANKTIPASILQSSGSLDESLLYERIKGHYYWFFFQDQEVRCGTSFGGIFPIYYEKNDHGIKICSSAFYLAEQKEHLTPSKRNLLERLLFNYTFFDSSWWEEILLLPAHRYLHLDKQGAGIEGEFEVSNYFGQVEDRSKDSLERLGALFQKETELFFPDAPFAISLTGGFDGRTLVAASLKANKSFKTYSFGRPGSSDVTVPDKQSQKLGISYYPIYLDQKYVREEALEAGNNFLSLTGYNGNFGRPHYEYAARQLSQEVDYILTGNFGSELFRALHLPGVMMSEALITTFSAKDNSWKDVLKLKTAQWDSTFFEKELDALISDLEQYQKKRNDWDPNHKFYDFVFNEIFRKYFGPELVMQSHYFNNRTPYLNLEFFRELNRTIWSGVHARLFEKMKNKRMKGQMFYASFIRQSHQKMYHLSTNKGYSPAEVMEKWRFPFLVSKVVMKKFIQKPEMDSNSVEAFFRKDYKKLAQHISPQSPPFLTKHLQRSHTEISRGQNIQEWVRFYSILVGWEAAQSAGSTISQSTISS